MNIPKYSTKNYFAQQTSCDKITKRQTNRVLLYQSDDIRNGVKLG